MCVKLAVKLMNFEMFVLVTIAICLEHQTGRTGNFGGIKHTTYLDFKFELQPAGLYQRLVC